MPSSGRAPRPAPESLPPTRASRSGCPCPTSHAGSPSRAATSRPTSSFAADACSTCSRASGSRPTSRSSTASSPGSATTTGAETLDAAGRYVVPGLHRRPHAPRVVASSCSTSSRGSCCRSGRRRSSPTRTRSRTCSAPTACTGCSTRPTGCRSTSTSWPRRACRPRVRVAAARAHDRRPRRAAAPARACSGSPR